MAYDRADAVTAAIVQALLQCIAENEDLRARLVDILRDEFADAVREAVADLPQPD
jgi:hypothetical protein